MNDAPISKNIALKMSLANTRPDVDGILEKLPLPAVDTITVVNGAGHAWTKETGGEWVKRANPSLTSENGVPFKNETGLPRILAITPYHPSYGIKPQTLASIQAAMLAYDGPVDWIHSHNDNPHEVGYHNVTRHHNKARAIALNGGYDYMLSIEADMKVPADAIDMLLACDADVAYGLYVWRHGLDRWSAYDSLGIFGGGSVSVRNAHAYSTGIHDVKGVGMGCTLIKRNVLERFPFRLYTGDKDDWLINEVRDGGRKAGFNINPYEPHTQMFCDDWLFALDANHYGFTQRTNFDLICGHIDNGKVLWPDINADKYVRIEQEKHYD